MTSAQGNMFQRHLSKFVIAGICIVLLLYGFLKITHGDASDIDEGDTSGVINQPPYLDTSENSPLANNYDNVHLQRESDEDLDSHKQGKHVNSQASYNNIDKYQAHRKPVYTGNREYIDLAETTWNETWQILHDEHAWKKEVGDNLNSGIVYSKNLGRSIGQVTQLKGYINTSPANLYKILITEIEDVPKWHDTMDLSQVLEWVREDILVDYVVTKPIAGGVISSRDYVSIRHWKIRDNVTLSAGTSTTHPLKPVTKKIIRGVDKPGGMMWSPVQGEPNKSLLQWSINTVIGGWIPQWVVDQSIATTMVEFLQHLQERAKREH